MHHFLQEALHPGGGVFTDFLEALAVVGGRYDDLAPEPSERVKKIFVVYGFRF